MKKKNHQDHSRGLRVWVGNDAIRIKKRMMLEEDFGAFRLVIQVEGMHLTLKPTN